MCCKVTLQSKRLHRSKSEGKPSIDSSKTWHQEKVDHFVREIEDALPGAASTSAAERWEYLTDTVYNAAISAFGKRNGNTMDGFEAHSK